MNIEPMRLALLLVIATPFCALFLGRGDRRL